MAERHAIRSASVERCSVKECQQEAIRSVSAEEAVEKAKLVIEHPTGKRAHLCREHYKVFKRATAEERELRKLSWK
ncbi:MAG: hypothetical protein QXP70_00705 [Methanomassiliicoccales archaeon]